MLQGLLRLTGIKLGHQHGNIVADHFFRAVAEDVFGGGVEGANQPLASHRNNAFIHVVEHRPNARLVAAQFLVELTRTRFGNHDLVQQGQHLPAQQQRANHNKE